MRRYIAIMLKIILFPFLAPSLAILCTIEWIEGYEWKSGFRWYFDFIRFNHK